MADINSSLPVRTEANGDIVTKICDGTTNTQLLNIDANGRIAASVEQTNAANLNATVVATDLDIRNLSNAQDNILVYGWDGAANQKVRTNAAGNLDIVSTSGVTVSQATAANLNATVVATDLDIRNLTSASDSVEVLQSTAANLNATVVATDLDIRNLTYTTDSVTVKQASGDVWEVHVTETGAGDEIHDYNTAVAVGSGLSNTHTYTVTSGKTLYLHQVWASASGKLKIEVKTGVVGSETTKAVGFASTSDANINLHFAVPIVVNGNDNVLVIRTNRDKTAQDVYSTIVGLER